MKIIIKKSSLEACVKNLCKVINKKNVLPILGDILFDVNEQEKTLKLTASDSEIYLSYQLSLDEAEGGGRFCIPAKQIQAMLSEVSDQPLALTIDHMGNQQFEMAYDKGWARCPIENADEYPMPVNIAVADTTIFNFDGNLLTGSVKRSLFATANDELRPILNGVYLNFHDNQLDVVGTNGQVVIRTEITIDDYTTAGVILPKKIANILHDVIGENQVNIIMHDRDCRLEVKDGFQTMLHFRCIEGTYVNYNSVIKTTLSHAVVCDRMDLLSALKAVKPFTPDSSNLVSLTFDEDDQLTVTGEDYDFSAASSVTIGTEGYNGQPMTIGMKASHLIDILSHLKCFNVEIIFEDPNHSVVIRPADKAEGDPETITCLQMPMLIND